MSSSMQAGGLFCVQRITSVEDNVGLFVKKIVYQIINK